MPFQCTSGWVGGHVPGAHHLPLGIASWQEAGLPTELPVMPQTEATGGSGQAKGTDRAVQAERVDDEGQHLRHREGTPLATASS